MHAATALVVDDDPEFLGGVTTALRAHGFGVDAFADPRRALDHACGAARPDVVLVEFAMNDMNGLQFVRALRDAAIEVPVILMVGLKGSRLGVLPVHFARVFRKPVHLDELLDAVATLSAPPLRALATGG
jgi:DNA-binding response OmpR family regulator